MKQQIENIIKKYLPEKKKYTPNFQQSEIYIGGFNQALSQINTSLIADEVLKVVVDKILLEMKGWVKSDTSITGIGLLNIMQDSLLSNLSPNKENKIQGSSGGNGYNSPVHIPPTGENGYGETVGCNCEKCLLIK